MAARRSSADRVLSTGSRRGAQLILPGRYTYQMRQPGNSFCRCSATRAAGYWLIDLDLALPDPWQDYRERRASERREAAEREQELLRADEDDDLARPGTPPGTRPLGSLVAAAVDWSACRCRATCQASSGWYTRIDGQREYRWTATAWNLAPRELRKGRKRGEAGCSYATNTGPPSRCHGVARARTAGTLTASTP